MNFKAENKINRIKHYAYQSEDLIGRGAAGKVYKGLNEQNGEQVAIKIMEMDKIDNEVTEYLLACEKDALMSIDNPYVLHAYEIVQTELQCLIITPLCNGGTLKQHIVAKGKLPESEALHIFVKLLRGYLAIRNKGFIHRDIKSSNVMFRDGDPVIIDFGYCEKTGGKKPKMFYNVGSPSYMSPEAYMKTLYSEKSDIWSLGIVLYEMLEGFTIDHGQPIDRYFSSLLRNGPSFRSKITEATKQMVKTVLNPNYHDRPHVQFIIQNVERIIFYGNQPQKHPSPTPAAPKNSHNSQPNIPSTTATTTTAKISLKQSQKKANNQILSEKLIESRYKYEQMQQQQQQTPGREKEKEADMGKLMEEKLKGSPMRLLVQNQARTEVNGVGFKLSQSVYRQEVRANGKVFVNQPQKINSSFISKEMAQNMHSQPVFQPQHQQRPPSQQLFMARSPQEQAFIAAQNQGRFMPTRIPQPSPKLQVRLEKLTPEYRSMMAPSSQPQQPTKPTVLENNTKNPNVFHSKLFNAQSFLSVEDREAIGSGQLFANIKMIDSISNQKTTASGNGLFGRQGNPVVQSLIVEPHYQQQQQQQGRTGFRENQPVYQSVIINQPASSFSSQQLHFMQRQSFQPPQVQFQQQAYPQQMQFPIRTSFHQQAGKPRPQFLPPQLNFAQFPQFQQYAPQPQPQPQFQSQPNRNTAPVSNPRPFSPIANEGKQMFINQSARENNRVVFENASKNFIKKTEPYFHMNNNMNGNMNMNVNGNQKIIPQFHQHHEFQPRQTMPTFQPRTAPTPHRMPQGLQMPPQAMFRR